LIQHNLEKTYPDSVSLVKPPKTTIPKTLAALPSNQYATDLELCSGKLVLDFSVFPAPIRSLSEARGEEPGADKDELLRAHGALLLASRTIRDEVDFPLCDTLGFNLMH
jgi:hypothetical protein